jgi:hypothetical protein
LKGEEVWYKKNPSYAYISKMVSNH